jgi:hypothetical protein
MSVMCREEQDDRDATSYHLALDPLLKGDFQFDVNGRDWVSGHWDATGCRAVPLGRALVRPFRQRRKTAILLTSSFFYIPRVAPKQRDIGWPPDAFQRHFEDRRRDGFAGCSLCKAKKTKTQAFCSPAVFIRRASGENSGILGDHQMPRGATGKRGTR